MLRQHRLAEETPVAAVYALVVSDPRALDVPGQLPDDHAPGDRVHAADLAFLGADAAFGYAFRVGRQGLEP